MNAASRNSSVVYPKTKNSFDAKICMISSFKLLLNIMKLNLKRINSYVVSILVSSCENRHARSQSLHGDYYIIKQVTWRGWRYKVLFFPYADPPLFSVFSTPYLIFLVRVTSMRPSLFSDVFVASSLQGGIVLSKSKGCACYFIQ